jgi:hypothetical protein
MAFLLELPWGISRYMLMKYKGKLKTRGGSLFLYDDNNLPSDLKDFTTEDFTYARWLEDDYRLETKQTPLQPQKGAVVFKPRPHQLEGAKAIYTAFNTGWPGFLLADKTGVGKTLTGLTAVTAIAKKQGFTPQNKATLLIVCPKGVIPVWRQTIHNYPASTSLMRPLVINYQQLNKLLKAPPQAKTAKKQRTKNRATASQGTPTVNWDYIILDEAHYGKNYPSSAASIALVNIAQTNKTYIKGKSPFVLYSTATPGSSPLNFALMANFLGRLLTKTPSGMKVTPSTWGPFLEEQGFAVKKGKVSYTWAAVPWFGKNSADPKEKAKYAAAVANAKNVQRKDALRIGKALLQPGAPFIMRSPKDIAGWPEQQLVPLPLAMTPEQKPVYEEAWTRFRKWLKLTPAKSDPKAALVENLRYRQKASLLKVDAIVDNIEELVEGGNQVFVSVEFIETLQGYLDKLTARGIKCSEISGRNVNERTTERLRFQKGETKVVLCTVVAGISLHANEILPDGTSATSAPRITILSDIRQNPLDAVQALGRAHRDGMNSLSYIPYLENTVDERVTSSFVNKYANMQVMTGQSQSNAEDLEALFREAASNERI